MTFGEYRNSNKVGLLVLELLLPLLLLLQLLLLLLLLLLDLKMEHYHDGHLSTRNGFHLCLKLVGPIGQMDFALKEVFGSTNSNLSNVDAHKLG